MHPPSGAVFQKGPLRLRLAQDQADLDRALALRGAVFRAGGDDRDGLDAICQHVLIERLGQAGLQGCFRFLILPAGHAIGQSYAAQRYDLAALATYPRPILELGRFCLAPGLVEADVVRLCWAFLTRQVDAAGAGLLCGCTSFPGSDPAAHRAALAALRDHLAPERLAPRPLLPGTYAFAADLAGHRPDPRAALAGMPPLLRSYLALGGWVSDHAVPDRDLDTLHVFTAVEVAAIPAARARALRAWAQD